MELPVNYSDDKVEELILRTEPTDEDIEKEAKQEAASSSASQVDPITKWIQKKELFIQLEREEDEKQTEQAIAILPLKVSTAQPA